MSALINRHFHTWVVREAIGAGGVAEVFRVEHIDDPSSFAALKVLRPEAAGERRHVLSLEREHALLAGLDHPGIPKARRLGEIAGRPALLMDFVPGPTLAELVAAGREFDAARAFLDLAGIIAFLHGEGIVHNDLKPENAILEPGGRLALVDFGSAREPRGTSLFRRFFKRQVSIFGTAAYLAPELIAGHQPSFASDIYALGVCAFAVLTGAQPFNATSRSGRLRAHAREDAPSIRERLPRLTPRMAKAIDACLDKRPTARPDAEGLLGALAGFDETFTRAQPRTRRVTMGTAARKRAASRH